MALVPCGECRREISDSAASCPHCGFKNGRAAAGRGGALAVIAALLVAYCALGSLSDRRDSPPGTKQPVDLDAKARGLCMFAIKDKLHDPGSAEFSHSRDVTMTKDGNIWTVIRPVRAKNGYGSIRLERFACVFRYSGAETLDLMSVTQLP